MWLIISVPMLLKKEERNYSRTEIHFKTSAGLSALLFSITKSNRKAVGHGS
jgi:hypothetical protein